MVRRTLGQLVLIIVGLVLYSHLQYLFDSSGIHEKDVIANTFNCKEPCVVKQSNGGNIFRFNLAAIATLQGERNQIVIDGDCFSACALFADYARPKVCITKRARFGLHRGTFAYPLNFLLFSAVVVKRFDPAHSPDIAQWAKTHGDYPEEGLAFISAQDALAFWPLCELNPVLPKQDPRKHTGRTTLK